MADLYSPIVTFNTRGYDLWTKIHAVRSDPNPSANLVQIDWEIEGGASSSAGTTGPVSETCAWIKGFRNPSGSYEDSKDASVAYDKKWKVELASGYNDPANTDMGQFYIYACCRVEAVADASSFLLVTTHNYIEVVASNFLTPSYYPVVETSDSQLVRLRVRKI